MVEEVFDVLYSKILPRSIQGPRGEAQPRMPHYPQGVPHSGPVSWTSSYVRALPHGPASYPQAKPLVLTDPCDLDHLAELSLATALPSWVLGGS